MGLFGLQPANAGPQEAPVALRHLGLGSSEMEAVSIWQTAKLCLWERELKNAKQAS